MFYNYSKTVKGGIYMSGSSNPVILKDILLHEHAKMSERIIYYGNSATGLGQIAVALASASGLVEYIITKESLTEVIHIIQVVIPLVINALLLFALMLNARSMQIGGHIKYLEYKLSMLVDSPVTMWETAFSGKKLLKKSAFTLMGLLIVMFFGLIAVSLIQLTRSSYSIFSLVSVIVVALLESIGFVLSTSELRSIHDKTFQACLEYEKLDVSIKYPLNAEQTARPLKKKKSRPGASSKGVEGSA